MRLMKMNVLNVLFVFKQNFQRNILNMSLPKALNFLN